MIGIYVFISFIIFLISYSLFVIVGENLFEDGTLKAVWNICFFIISICISLEFLDVYVF